jgi:hypothetical protein
MSSVNMRMAVAENEEFEKCGNEGLRITAAFLNERNSVLKLLV